MWNEGVPQRTRPSLLFVHSLLLVCFAVESGREYLAWSRLRRMLWGIPHSVNLRLLSLVLGRLGASIPGLPLGVLKLAGGPSREEGELGP